jgi:hypothetical protein
VHVGEEKGHEQEGFAIAADVVGDVAAVFGGHILDGWRVHGLIMRYARPWSLA